MKITFVTYHNWKTKRIGGLHIFAEACADAGHEVVFFSLARPYFIWFKHEERLNKHVLRNLSNGIDCRTEREAHLVNCTWPTLRLPMPIYNYVPRRINHWLNTHSLGSFGDFQEKFLSGTDVFVFESCDGVELFDKIRRYNPDAKYVYRPSDPMVAWCGRVMRELEWNIMTKSDLTLIVNEEGLELYRKTFSNFDKFVKWDILSNGVDAYKFEKRYPVPPQLDKPNTALYVGARDAQWDLLLYSAKKCPNINFVIVCPENPSAEFLEAKLPNMTYIPGIAPNDVPAWITNCDVVIIPNPKGEWKRMPWGITAKYYQAMKARKPIVAYEDTQRLKKEFNVDVAYSFDDFIIYLTKAMDLKGERDYVLENKDWTDISSRFIESIDRLRNLKNI